MYLSVWQMEITPKRLRDRSSKLRSSSDAPGLKLSIKSLGQQRDRFTDFACAIPMQVLSLGQTKPQHFFVWQYTQHFRVRYYLDSCQHIFGIPSQARLIPIARWQAPLYRYLVS